MNDLDKIICTDPKIKDALESGQFATGEEIASSLGMTGPEVRRELRKLNRRWKKRLRNRPRKGSSSEKILAALRSQVIPNAREVADDLQVCISTVYSTGRRFSRGWNRRPPTGTKAARIVACFDSGDHESAIQIAKAVGCFLPQVYQTLDRYRGGWRRHLGVGQSQPRTWKSRPLQRSPAGRQL